MFSLRKNQINNDEISPEILNNFDKDESLQFYIKTQKNQPLSRFNLLATIVIIIMAIFLIFMSIESLDEANFFASLSPALIIILLFAIGFLTFIQIYTNKKENYEIALSNKNLYVIMQITRFPNLKKLKYDQIKAISAIIKDKKNIGYGDLYVYVDDRIDDRLGIMNYKIVIPNIPNISVVKSEIDHIIWKYSNLGRLTYNYPIELDTENTEFLVIEKKFRNYRNLLLIGAFFLIIGIISMIISFLGSLSPFVMVPVLVFATGFSFSVTFGINFRIISKLLPKREVKVVLYQDKITYYTEDEKFDLSYDNLELSLYSKLVRVSKGEMGLLLLGVIKIKGIINGVPIQIKYGPIIKSLDTLSQIYISYLQWQANKSVSQEETKIPRRQQFTNEKDNSGPVLKPLDEIPTIAKSIENYLDVNEQIHEIFEPLISFKKEQLILITSGMSLPITITLFILMFSGQYYLISASLISLVATLLLCVMGLPTALLLQGKRLMNKSIYILTSHRLITKHPKHLILVKFNEISLINRIEKKKSYEIHVLLEEPLAQSPLMAKDRIIIPNIPLNNDFFRKMLELVKN